MAKQLTIPSVVNQEYEQVSVGLIKPHSRNVNQGDKGKIYQSIQDNGFYGACVVQRSTRLILAGSHRWEAAKQAGMPAVPVIWADVDDDAALRIMLSDNATARAGNDDPNALAELLAELAGTDKGLSGTGFDGDDLQDLIDTLAGMPQSGLLADADPDAIPDDAPTRVRPGQLWQLGNHRLLCGDNTKPEDVTRLMGDEKAKVCITDPPYNIGYEYESYDDSKTPAQYAELATAWFTSILTVTPCVIITPGRQNIGLWSTFGKHEVGAWIKSNAHGGASIAHFAKWEPIFFFGKQLRQRASDVFEHYVDNGFLNDGAAVGHTCPKPARLWKDLTENYSLSGDVLYEPFAGSGTGFVTAEDTGRKCYGMEIEPNYCSIILERYERATGKTAELIEHGTT